MVHVEIMCYLVGYIAMFNKVEKVNGQVFGQIIGIHFDAPFCHKTDRTARAVFVNKAITLVFFNPVQLVC